MKILIVPDSFKDSLTSIEVCDCIEEGIRRIDDKAICIKIPMADGGEGTVHSIIAAAGGKIIPVSVNDPLMRGIESFIGLIDSGNTAVIEMAAASGIELLLKEERNPLKTTSFGTGQLIASAIEMGVSKIILGLGGSATNDGGAGMAEALGIKFYDENGKILHPTGGNLDLITKIIVDDINPSLKTIEIILATDVNNKMCGPEGASYVYGPQKGGTPDMIQQLDKNLFYFGDLLEKQFGRIIKDQPGSGAAGGLAAVLIAMTRAKIKSGFEVIREAAGIDAKIKEADLVITGEGKIDYQTFYGKAPYSILQLGKKYNKPVIAIAGSVELSKNEKNQSAFSVVIPILEKPCSLEYAISNAADLVRNATERMYKLILMKVTI